MQFVTLQCAKFARIRAFSDTFFSVHALTQENAGQRKPVFSLLYPLVHFHSATGSIFLKAESSN